MSLWTKLFRPKKYRCDQYFDSLSYSPTYHSFRGELYESELVRAAIDATARHISKLQVKIQGAAQPKTQTILKKHPNEFMTWSQFLYRSSTILDCQNSLFLIPIIDVNNDITGIWPCLPNRCKMIEGKNNKLYLEYEFSNDQKAAVEWDRVGVMTKFQYKDDFFGESNDALKSVMDLITIERQGIAEGVKSAGTFRFLARSTNFKDPEDLAQEQRNFTTRNLSADASGFLLFPNVYDGIQQIQSAAYRVSAEEADQIQKSVNMYFGINEDIIMSKAYGPALDAFFDGRIEPFAIQMQEVLTRMLFTDTEQGYGAKVIVAANRLQYMSWSEKINFIANLSDRGFITINEGRELLNYDPLPEEVGGKLPIRGEFKYVGEDTSPAPEGEDDGNQIESGIPNDPAAGDAVQSEG